MATTEKDHHPEEQSFSGHFGEQGTVFQTPPASPFAPDGPIQRQQPGAGDAVQVCEEETPSYAHKGQLQEIFRTRVQGQPVATQVAEFSQRNLTGEISDEVRSQYQEIITAFIEAAAAQFHSAQGGPSEATAGTTVSPESITLTTEAERAGYDAVAQLIESHTNVRWEAGQPSSVSDPWTIRGSNALMEALENMGYWMDFPRRLVEAAEAEYRLYTNPEDGRQYGELVGTETDTPIGSTIRGRHEDYWGDTAEATGDAANMADRSTRDDRAAWSAAFISSMVMSAGAGDTFAYSYRHTDYAVAGFPDGDVATPNFPLAMADPSPEVTSLESTDGVTTQPISVGSLIHRRRPGGTGASYGPNDLTGASHVDIATAIEIYDGEGNLIPGNCRDIVADPAYANAQIFAVSIGGNTHDERLEFRGGQMQIIRRNRHSNDGMENGNTNETVGRRYWPLNRDFTVNNSTLGDRQVLDEADSFSQTGEGDTRIYGVQDFQP